MVLEILMIFFCAVLLGFTFWALFGLLLTPVFGKYMITYCFSGGDGDTLEHTVRSYGWLREGKKNGGRLVVVDCGLSAEGLELVKRLRQDRAWLSYCPYETLTDYTQLLQHSLEKEKEL